jgi:hypothetical protein
METLPKALVLSGIILIIVGASLSLLYLQGMIRWYGWIWLPLWSIGTTLTIVGIIYAIAPRIIAKIMMGIFLILVNSGFLYALWRLWQAYHIPAPLFHDILPYFVGVLLPAWFLTNVAGIYYFLFLRTKEW